MSPPHSSGRGLAAGRGARRPSRRTVVALVAAAVVLVVGAVVAVVALSRDGASGAGTPSTADGGSTAATETAAVKTRVVRVAGKLRPAAKRRLTREVGSLVERFASDAYVEGRHDFPDFTEQARRLARRDADVTTGRRLARGGEVVLRSGSARLSVLSTRPRQPVGVTAAVRLVLDTEGSARPVTVTGRLLLTPVARGWRVFGYDLASSAPPASSGAGNGEGASS